MATSSEAMLEQWREWLANIDRDVTLMFHRRTLWREFIGMLAAAEPMDWTFGNAFTRMYGDSQVMGVRRQAEIKGGVHSLARLIDQLRQHPTTLTRKRFVALWEQIPDNDPYGHFAEWANAGYDRFTVKPGLSTLSPGALQADVELMQTTALKLKEWADATVAHADSKRPDSPTFLELDSALDVMGDMLVKYTYLLTASSKARVDPHIQGDWQQPFRKALADPPTPRSDLWADPDPPAE